MQNIVITKVEEHISEGGKESWHVYQDRGNGLIWGHAIPKVAFEWRIAEYDLDPEDEDLVFDILLHEPFIPNPRRRRNFKDDAAAKMGLTVPARRQMGRGLVQEEQVPIWLYNAPTIALARKAHLARVEHAKTVVNFQYAEKLGGARDVALGPLKSDARSMMDSERLELMKMRVKILRANLGLEDPVKLSPEMMKRVTYLR